MKNILCICNNFATGKDANGICAKNIVDCLLSREYNVIVLTVCDEDLQGAKYNIKCIKNEAECKGIKHVIEKINAGISYPNTKPKRTKVLFDEASRIIIEEKIDTVINFYKPFDTLYVGYQIKQRFNSVYVINYHLDILTDPDDERTLFKIYKTYKGKRFFELEREMADLIILPMSLEGNIKGPNILYTDFPLYIKQECIDVGNLINFESDNINITYIGSLDSSNRNPQKIIELIKQYNEKNNRHIKLHIWGNVDNIVKKEFKEQYINYYGMVENKYVYSILRKSDFLLNISNKNTNKWIPSKIFGLFSTRKPVINVVSNCDDYSKKYFDLYNFGFELDEFRDTPDLLEQFESFVSSFLGKECSDNIDRFIKSTPQYFIDLIEESYDKKTVR